MFLLPLASLVAQATELERFPLAAPLTLTDCAPCTEAQRRGEGAVRVALPIGLRTPVDAADGSDLLVVDAQGEPVPFAVVRGIAAADTTQLLAIPTEAPNTFRIPDQDRPIDGLDIDLYDSSAAATVRVWEERDDGLVALGEPTLVFSAPAAERRRVSFPSSAGPFRVELTHHFPYNPGAPDIDGYVDPEVYAGPQDLTLPVAETRLLESGWARYTVELPQALPLSKVRLTITDSLFDRGVMVSAEAIETAYQSPSPTDRVARLLLGGATVDDVMVDIPDGVAFTDVLYVYVQAEGREPLTIPEVTVRLSGVHLLLHNPGPGPFTVYGGAPAGTTPSSDLASAVPELSRLARRPMSTGEVAPNPDYSPPELRANLAVPGAELEETFAWSREVIAEPGLVRIPLDTALIAGLRSDQGDLRLVDEEGKQIPYLLRRRADEAPTAIPDLRRTEEGGQSRIRLAIPDAAVPISTLRIDTGAPLFSRRLTLFRADGPDLVPLRTFQWNGQDRPASLTLDLGQAVGAELLLVIDNGDNPPLPITAVAFTRPNWELVAWVPEDGASLRYGNARVAPPSYDLALLRSELLQRPMVKASLDDPQALGPPVRSRFESLALFAGIAVLVAGLAGLTLSLLRGVPASAPPPSPQT